MEKINIIIEIIKNIVIEISYLINNSDPNSLSHLIDTTNTSNDDVIDVDIKTNEIFHKHLSKCKHIRTIMSEEDETAISTKYENGEYMVSFDPLDGSKNLEVNVTTGSIFCIFEYNNNTIESGHNIVYAGYSLYGIFTQFLSCIPNNIELLTLNKTTNNFQLSKEIYNLPDEMPFYSINQGYANLWLNKNIANYIKEQGNQGKSLRFVGSMVADVHRAIIKGGNFMYPRNENNKDGRLRLVYEVYPMSFIFECLGGYGITETGDRILNKKFPKDIHQKSPVLLLNKYEKTKFF